ncbi:MAG TPA: TIGR03915 family putative DNA repair protein [Pedobacter sp.]|nr:TIGR03915 family putative DNA repair protein [Pedobacter sp.]
MTVYLIDGSLEGLLCAVFECFERKPGDVLIKTDTTYLPDVFSPVLCICNDASKADRVWKGLMVKLPATWLRKFYCAFLAEDPAMFQSLFEFCCYIFNHSAGAETNYGNEHVLRIAKTARMVEREKHRMEAFIRFRQLKDGMFYCAVDPDFNVLPLIMKHFKDRYADQQWIIYDISRHYGICYDMKKVEEVHLERSDERALKKPGMANLDVDEDLYASLWKNYFKSANIEARKNTKLHVRHVPKRYWKYLTEIR